MKQKDPQVTVSVVGSDRVDPFRAGVFPPRGGNPAQSLARALESRGYASDKVVEPCELEDGAIYFGEKVHVQVGFDYCNVVRKTSSGSYSFYPQPDHLDGLIEHLRDALVKSVF